MTMAQTRPETERFIAQCQTLSTEAFGNEGIADVITKHLPKFSASLKDAFRFVTTWDFSRPEVINVSSVNMRLRQVRYTDLEAVNVPKPVGFIGNMHDYVAGLKNQKLDYLVGVGTEVLETTTKHLAYYLNDLDNLQERRVGQLPEKYRAKVLASLIDQEAQWLVEGNRSSEAPFTDLFANNADCMFAMMMINDINQQRWAKANPTDLAKRVQRLQQTADALFGAIQESETAVSRPVMAKIADELELAAKWVEWFSVMQTRIIDTTSAMKQMEKVLLRVL